MSESLVLEKQLDAREEYLKIKELNLPHEGRNLDGPVTMETFLNHEYTEQLSGPWSADPRVVTLGYLSNLLSMNRDSLGTIRDINDKIYKLESVLYGMDVSSIMNSRGSVKQDGTNGYVVSKIVRKGNQNSKQTQNAKCYSTILQLASDMCNGALQPKVDPSYPHPPESSPRPPVDLAKVLTLPDKAYPLVLFCSQNEAACVSKMVHKDQIGAREIAVLNAPSRVMCKYVEDVARKIRDDEHRVGNRINLIEIKNKIGIVKHTLQIGLSDRKTGRKVAFDSADCSKWGPSMMPHTLYLSLALRMAEGTELITMRNCLSLFSMKVFKIPDEFYMTPRESLSGKKAREVHDRLVRMRPPLGDWSSQLIYLEESMHQGILGSASSVLGSDAQSLSNYVTDKTHSHLSMRTISHITSDDYSRVITWKGDEGLFSVGKTVLAMHTDVLRMFGIKRNLQKSGLSTDYFEFNSIFFTSSGEYRPDVKSRLSFIDYSASQDAYEVSLEAANKGAEYLRSEGSVIGSLWVCVLNNSLAMIQNQSERLFKTLGDSIHKVPLELGGLIRPDTLLSTGSIPQAAFFENYEPYDNCDPSITMANIIQSETYDPTLTLETETEFGEKILVPSLSRSGVVHLARRPHRSLRAIREFLMHDIDMNLYMEVFRGRNTSSYLLALMACAQRESKEGGSLGTSLNFSSTQTPHDAKVFLINSSYFMDLLGEDRVSRDDLHRAAQVYLQRRSEIQYTCDWPIDMMTVKQELEVHRRVTKLLKPLKITPMPKFTVNDKKVSKYCGDGFLQQRLTLVKEVYRPQVFGGDVDIHPWLYQEAMETYKQRLMKLGVRRQWFRMNIRNDDALGKNWFERILTSDFVGGGRLHYEYDIDSSVIHRVDDRLERALTMNYSMLHWSRDGVAVDMFSPYLNQLDKNMKVRSVDITTFMNILAGDDLYLVTNQPLKEALVSHLRMCQDLGARFSIDPAHLTMDFHRKKFVSTSNHVIYQYPFDSGSNRCGREIILQSKGKYRHFVHSYHYDVDVPKDDDTDVYHVIKYSENMVRVKFMMHTGFTMLVLNDDEMVPLQVISSFDVSHNKITFFTEENIETDRELLHFLKEKGQEVKDVGKIVQAIQLTQGRVDDDWYDDSDKPPDDEDEELVNAYDVGSDSDGFDIEYDLSDDDSDIFEHKSDKSSSDDEEVYDIEEVMDMPRSETGMVLKVSEISASLMRSTITRAPPELMRRAKKRNPKIVAGYELYLPYKPSKTLILPTEKSSVWSVLRRAEEAAKEEGAWLHDYVIDSLKSYPPIRTELELMWAEEATLVKTSAEDDSDDDWGN